jgi:hypothetical protein
MFRLGRLGALLAIVFATSGVHAEAGDPAAARELLKRGYELKEARKFEEALPVLLESYRLAPELKTLINVADCLEGLRRYTEAQQRWVQARDRARAEGNAMFRKETERRLTELEGRMPRLTIVVSPAAPPGTEVLRNGVLLGKVSLGSALPADPGKHQITARAPDREARTFEVTLADGDNQRVEVAPGDAAAASAAGNAPPAPAPVVGASEPESSAPLADSGSDRGNVQRYIGIGLGGLGVVAFGVAAGTWLAAGAKHEEALDHCPGSVCDDEARTLQSDAIDLVKLTNVAAITGSVLLAGGAVVYLTAPRGQKASALRARPLVGPSFAGVMFEQPL